MCLQMYPPARKGSQLDNKKREKIMLYLRGMTMGALLTAIALAVIGGIVLYRSRKEPSGADVLTSLKTRNKMAGVADLIRKNYYYEEDPELLEIYLFKGIAAGLDDPYAAYYSPEELENVERSNEGRYFGIGIIFSIDGELPLVEDIYEGSAADRAGILPGDHLLEIDGKETKGLTSDEVADLISEKEETGEIGLVLERKGEKIALSVSFEMVKTTVTESEMLDAQTGYIRLPQFTVAAAEEFDGLVKSLQEQGAEQLILDIRDNPGGLLESVCDIFGAFVSDEEIVHILRRDGQEDTVKTKEGPAFKGTVAVLVNGGSASASELLAGGMQDLGIGPVIGQKTYGKGVVQSTYYLRDGSAFKFTTEKYLTAHRRDIDRAGVEPDVVLEGMEEMTQEQVLEIAAGEALKWKRE